jgi:hypothetical protein
MDTRLNIELNGATAPRSRLTDWLWRPWYAKLWWTAIPLWWAGMAAAFAIEPLARFYDSALAGFLNVLFFPMTALLVLGVGFVRHWIDGFPQRGNGTPPSFAELADIAAREEENDRAFEALNAMTDIHDPRSDGLYIGNPFSLQHPGRH